MISTGYVRFPPNTRHVLVPVRPRAAAALGTTLYTTSRPRALFAQRLTWAAVRLGGLRLLPGDREGWNPPFDREVLATMHSQWSRAIGGVVDGVAVYNRPQQHRSAVALLVCAGRRSLLVRVRMSDEGLALERDIADHVRDVRIETFRVPEARAAGSVGDWKWVGFELMGTRPHAPVVSAGAEVFAEVSAVVESVVPRPANTPATWRGAHGDLTPWNFRRARGTRWLIDWEDACYAPLGADRTYFALTAAVLQRRPGHDSLAVIARYDEARSYWRENLRSRRLDGKDVRLVERMLTLLG